MSLHHRADRRFGQNFLANPELAESIVGDFDPAETDAVAEIGPGKGALTRVLSDRVAKLVALEFDERLIAGLQRLFVNQPSVEIVHADASRVDWSALSERLGSPLRVIGNLPFNAGTAILRTLLETECVIDMHLMLQLEVAQKVVATEGQKAYGPISVLSALRCERKLVRKLGPGAFRPAPKVSAGIVRLRFRETPQLERSALASVEKWLFRGFAQRRKTLANNLSNHRVTVASFLDDHGLEPTVRAEAIGPESWLDLARRLSAPGAD